MWFLQYATGSDFLTFVSPLFIIIQVTNEQLIVLDDYCIIAGTDTNFPGVNQFGLSPEQVPYLQEVSDTRFMVVCFLEPIFNTDYPILNE
jgi:hypothetical protein